MEPEISADVTEPEAPAPATPSPTDGLVEQWFVDWCCNQGFDVDLYNRLFAAKEDLKARLAGKE